MAFSVQMPALGESVTEGTVTRWLKKEGDRVEVDEPLLEVSTDKVDTEIPSPAAGVVQRIVVREDETVEVGAQLAVIGEGSENNSAPQQEPPTQPSQTERPQQPALTQLPESTVVPPASSGGEGTTVAMPALGESVTEGTVTRWLKRVGDTVEIDEPLLEVSTDKVDTEIPSPVAGTLLKILVGEDQTAEVGAPLAEIGSAEAVSAQPAPSAPAQPAAQPVVAQQPTPPTPAPPAATAPVPPSPQRWQPQPTVQPPAPEQADGEYALGDHPYVTPLVRKLATQHGIDLNKVTGTGVGGRIRKQDVEAAVEAAKAAAAKAAEEAAKATEKEAATAPSAPTVPPAATSTKPPAGTSTLRGKTEKLSRLRQIVAQRTRESLQISAQLTQVFEVDLTKIARLRSRAKATFEAREGVKLTFLPFFAIAAIEALKAHPVVNASIDVQAKTITYHDAEHLGIAVDTERGLAVPVIHNAGDLNLGGIARKIADLADRTRANKVSPDELGGGTFTITNTGSRGALFDTPIINQPQVAILGTGAVVKRPVVISDADLGETIAIRSMIYLALSYDHRIVDGADAARFLGTIKGRLEVGAFERALGLS